MEQGLERSQHRLEAMLQRIASLGGEAEGDVGAPDPMEAVKSVLDRESFDEVIVSTLPVGISRWMKMGPTEQDRSHHRLPGHDRRGGILEVTGGAAWAHTRRGSATRGGGDVTAPRVRDRVTRPPSGELGRHGGTGAPRSARSALDVGFEPLKAIGQHAVHLPGYLLQGSRRWSR